MVEISGAAPVRVARQPRRDPAPETDAERRIVALRAGVELGDGKPALAIGEVASVPAEAASRLVLSGACDYVAGDA